MQVPFGYAEVRFAQLPKCRSFDSAEVRFAQDDRSFLLEAF